jgi:hypothetical protein
VKESDLRRSIANCNKVQEWLLQEGYTLEEQTPGDGYAWWFLAANKEVRYGISQRLDHADEIYIRVCVEFNGCLAGLNPEEQKNFQKQIRLHMVHLDVEFDFDGVERVVVSARIFDDALTKDSFMSRVFRVQRAATVTAWLLSEKLEEAREPFKFFRPSGNSSLN